MVLDLRILLDLRTPKATKIFFCVFFFKEFSLWEDLNYKFNFLNRFRTVLVMCFLLHEL